MEAIPRTIRNIGIDVQETDHLYSGVIIVFFDYGTKLALNLTYT